jgi:hypothetical protein
MPGRLPTTNAQLKLRFCPSMISDGFGRRSRGRRGVVRTRDTLLIRHVFGSGRVTQSDCSSAHNRTVRPPVLILHRHACQRGILRHFGELPGPTWLKRHPSYWRENVVPQSSFTVTRSGE